MEYQIDGDNSWKPSSCVTHGKTSCEISNLIAGQNYKFRAYTSDGGLKSDTSSVIVKNPDKCPNHSRK